MVIEKVQKCLKAQRQLGWDWEANNLLEEINDNLESLLKNKELSPIETAVVGTLKKYKQLLLEAIQEDSYKE